MLFAISLQDFYLLHFNSIKNFANFSLSNIKPPYINHDENGTSTLGKSMPKRKIKSKIISCKTYPVHLVFVF